MNLQKDHLCDCAYTLVMVENLAALRAFLGVIRSYIFATIPYKLRKQVVFFKCFRFLFIDNIQQWISWLE